MNETLARIKSPYLNIYQSPVNMISVFDDLRYDRADADLLSPGMRNHVDKKLTSAGFKQESGRVFQHSDNGIRCIIPKSHALGASPFDITRYTPKEEADYYILTPTQTACQFIRYLSVQKAVESIDQLVKTQPVNLIRIGDYLDYESNYKAFAGAIPHLQRQQKAALASTSLAKMRALK